MGTWNIKSIEFVFLRAEKKTRAKGEEKGGGTIFPIYTNYFAGNPPLVLLHFACDR